MTRLMKQAIGTLVIMLFVVACLTVVTALALDEPARVVWFYCTVEVFLLSAGFVLGWSVQDRIPAFSGNGKHDIKSLGRCITPAGVGLVMTFLSFLNHGRSEMLSNLPELTGIEGSFAKASFDVLTIFHLVALCLIIYSLIVFGIRSHRAESSLISTSKEFNDRVGRQFTPSSSNNDGD